MILDRERLARIRSSMVLLLNHAEACAMNHYGEDFNAHGMPGWLQDCRKDVTYFTAMIDAAKENK